MSFLKTNDFAERQKNASAAKLSIIDKFKTAAQNPDPAAAEKAAARAEVAKARAILGWQPTIPLRDGLARTIAYFDALLSSG